MSRSRRAALVTLGCARNEVDSEELAGRLTADGWELTEDDDADVVLVNTCAFVASAKKDSIDTLLAAADGDRKVVAVGCLAERYGAELAESLPEAAAVLGFDAYGEIGARLDDVLAGRPLVPHSPRDRRTLLPITPVERQGHAVSVPGHASACRGPGLDAAGAAPPARRLAGRPAQAGLGLRPAVRVLRDPVVPRRVRLPAGRRAAGRGGLAGLAGRPRAGPGQRELHVVREGSRRPAAARAAAAGAGRGAGHRPGPAVLPAAGRDPAVAGRGAGRHARRRAVLRPVLPALQRGRAAPDAPVRRHRPVPRAARPGAGAGAGGRRAVQRHRRLPRRDQGRRGRADPVPHRGPAGRDRRVRLLGRGRHRGGRLRRARCART